MSAKTPRLLAALIVVALALGAGPAAAHVSAQDSFNFSLDSFKVNEADGAATITIVRTGTDAGAASVQFATTNGTATAGVDYTAVSQTVNFADGQSTATVPVPITNDSLGEGDETVQLTLTNPSSGLVLGSISSATLTIVDDDSGFAFGSGNFYAVESDGAAYITVRRLGLTIGAASVNVATADGTAIAGTDYTAVSQTLNFADAQSSQYVAVALVNNERVGGSETIQLSLSSPSAGTSLSDPHVVTLTVYDDDKPPPVAKPPAGKISSARLTTTNFALAQAGLVKLVYSLFPKSRSFAYVLSYQSSSAWKVVRTVRKTGAFAGPHSMTVKQLFGPKSIWSGRYRLKLSADKNSKTLTFKVI